MAAIKDSKEKNRQVCDSLTKCAYWAPALVMFPSSMWTDSWQAR